MVGGVTVPADRSTSRSISLNRLRGVSSGYSVISGRSTVRYQQSIGATGRCTVAALNETEPGASPTVTRIQSMPMTVPAGTVRTARHGASNNTRARDLYLQAVR